MGWARGLILLVLGLLGTLAPSFSQEQRPAIVYVVSIEGIIDLGLAPFVQRVLDEAAADGRGSRRPGRSIPSAGASMLRCRSGTHC